MNLKGKTHNASFVWWLFIRLLFGWVSGKIVRCLEDPVFPSCHHRDHIYFFDLPGIEHIITKDNGESKRDKAQGKISPYKKQKYHLSFAVETALARTLSEKIA